MPPVVGGFTGLGLGMNGALSPVLLTPAQFARGINVSIRGSLLKTRPGFVEEDLSLTCKGISSLMAPGDRIVFVVGGTVYLFFIETGVVTSFGALLSTTAQCFVTSVDRYLVVQDGISEPVILEDVSGVPQLEASFSEEETWSVTANDAGVTLLYPPTAITSIVYTPSGGADETLDPSTYSFSGVELTFSPALATAGSVEVSYTTVPSIPIGYMGVYAHGRLHMVPTNQLNVVPAVDGRDSILSGDVKLASDPSKVLRFTETEYLHGGGAHSLPLEMGFIGGIGVYRNAPTGTGNGEVIAFGRYGVAGFDFSLPREQTWSSQSLSRVLFFGSGSKSPWSIVNVNDDLVYRGLDGLRVLRYVITQTAGSSGGMSNLPISFSKTITHTWAWFPALWPTIGSTAQPGVLSQTFSGALFPGTWRRGTTTGRPGSGRTTAFGPGIASPRS